MNAAEALRTARAAGVELRLDGDDLVLSADSEPPAAVLDALSLHKAEIVAMLRPGPDGWSAEDWQAYYDERAGVIEFDGGLPRAQAEAQAFDCYVVDWLNLNPERSPAGRCLGCGDREYAHDPAAALRCRALARLAAFALLGSMARSPKGRGNRGSFKPWDPRTGTQP